jgi:nitrile hydratase
MLSVSPVCRGCSGAAQAEVARVYAKPLDAVQSIGHDLPMPHDLHDDDHAHSLLPPDPALRVKALETLLERKGLLDPAALDEIIETYAHKVGPQNGAQVVARAWSDAKFHTLLMTDATEAVSQMGFYGRQGEHVVAIANTPEVHNVVVCTLCSCYPWPLLGIPPGWYKSDAYRARVVREPRKVLAEFGVILPEMQKIRVWDSTAEVRYLIIPQRPAGTDGMSQEQLAQLVSRESMIGTGLARVPE